MPGANLIPVDADWSAAFTRRDAQPAEVTDTNRSATECPRRTAGLTVSLDNLCVRSAPFSDIGVRDLTIKHRNVRGTGWWIRAKLDTD
jgi:hypothetical protein